VEEFAEEITGAGLIRRRDFDQQRVCGVTVEIRGRRRKLESRRERNQASRVLRWAREEGKFGGGGGAILSVLPEHSW